MRCQYEHSCEEWDEMLAQLGGHPLQSALWGEAKKAVYGIKDLRLTVYDQDTLMALIRIENKGIKGILKLGWIPQGPALAHNYKWENIQDFLLGELKKFGYRLCVSTPWNLHVQPDRRSTRQTVWIDLQCGREQLWANLDKQWRYGARSAQRSGVQNCFAKTNEELAYFYQLCLKVSNDKDFRFQYSEAFLQYLLNTESATNSEAKLFLAKVEDKIAAGAFILRIGKNCHYMFGAMDRLYAKQRVGEFVQWSVIEWACEQGCALYDLEGIDEINNPGVASFKKKMGGVVIDLPGVQVHQLNWVGTVLSKLIRNKLQ